MSTALFLALVLVSRASEDLSKRYPGKLGWVEQGLSWTCGPEDVWQLDSFQLQFRKDFEISSGKASVAFGVHDGNVLWAVVFPDQPGKIRAKGQKGDGEAARTILLRFAPSEIGRMFPAKTVVGLGDPGLGARADKIFRDKIAGQRWSTPAGNPTIVQAGFTLVDVDTSVQPAKGSDQAAGDGRRFYELDGSAGSLSYLAEFEKEPPGKTGGARRPAGAGPFANGDFEAKGGKDRRPEGWVFELGAQNGATTPESEVELDTKEKHGGKAALRFRGHQATRGWIIAKQEIEARPGAEYRLEAWTRTAGVKPNGFGLDNCYVGLFLFDASGALAGRELARPRQPDSPWTKHELVLTAGPAVRKGEVYVFLSMLGELWVDDLALTITGGERIPAPALAPTLIWSEDFAKAKRLGTEWKKKVGATNGTGGTDSRVELDVEIDAQSSAPESPGSLRLSGDSSTMRWTHLTREFPAEPGDLWHWSGKVRAQDVRREGPQFANLHLNLAFVDGKGKALGNAHFGSLEPGTHEWSAVTTEGFAPEGTKKVQAGLFLSMSGTAWFDELELTVEKGLPVPYGDWITLEGEHVVLRYAPDHPHAGEMKAHHSALEQSKLTTCRALEVEFPEKITVFLYKDLAEGRLLTGGDLDFADPKNRRVHQQWDSYIGHEMVHVIAHNTLQYGQTGILGEGLAVWLNGQFRSHHGDARSLLDEGKLPSVKDLLERFREVQNSYPASGSFCGFLLETYGLETFKQLYPLTEPSPKLKELQSKSFEELEAEWHEHLKKF